jgi:RNA polymerase sigma-70 factor (ECF subfamily)
MPSGTARPQRDLVRNARRDPTRDPQIEAAREAVQNVQSTVDTVVRRLVGSRDPEYEDLVQSSIVNVLSTLDRGKFRGECPTGGWAAVIARNVAVDAIRARARERRVFQHGWDAALADDRTRMAPDPGPEKLTDIHLTLDRVNRALTGIGAKKARVVYLHDVLGYELVDVASMLGTSVAAAQSRLVRGRREIVDTMGAEARPAKGGASSRAAVAARSRRTKRLARGVLT